MTDIAEVWRRGSVISSWLLDLTAIALAKDGELNGFSGSVADSGEGQWTIDAAMEEKVPANVLTASQAAAAGGAHLFDQRLLFRQADAGEIFRDRHRLAAAPGFYP